MAFRKSGNSLDIDDKVEENKKLSKVIKVEKLFKSFSHFCTSDAPKCLIVIQ